VEVVYWKIMFLRPVETILRSGGGRAKENDGGGEFN
jgi:hypothetical protein